MSMSFGGNKMPVEIIKEVAFGGTYFRNIDSSINGKSYEKSRKEFDEINNIYQKCYCSSYYDLNVNKYGVKCGTSLRLWGHKGCINPIDLYGKFQSYLRYLLGKRSLDIKDKLLDGKQL